MAKIFNKSQDEWFVSDPNLMILDVGKVLEGDKDPNLKVGDKVYLTFTMTITAISSDIPDDFSAYFESFFSFWTDTDDTELSVRLLELQFPVDENGDILFTGDFIFTYLLDLSGLDSGEKIVNLWALSSDSGTEEIVETNLVSSGPFYLHQSILNRFQENIADGGVAGSRNGLERENVTFPSYLPVGLQPVNPAITKDVSLWTVIRNGTDALSFKAYSAFMDYLFCGGPNPFTTDNEVVFREKLKAANGRLALPFNNVDAYRALKVATESFVIASTTVYGVPDPQFESIYQDYLESVKTVTGSTTVAKVLPYLAIIRQKLSDIDFKSAPFEQTFFDYLDDSRRGTRLMESCTGLISSKLQYPCFLELIWSYWHEESMMVQGINAVARRFQNIRGSFPDPLTNVEIGPLRPINNLIWGYVQDEQHRLTVRRRAYEYDHHYGITLEGTALRGMTTADTRSKFIEAFHTLLNLCIRFYKQYDDTTVVADGFPIMNGLKETHMILSEGAHNQFGDLPSTARIEMLMQQYILARPEFREYLPTRQMVPYPEAWMDRVAVLNQIHNWTKTSVLHFRDLGVFGEQIVLSIRFGAWSDVIDRNQAANWAIFWRPQIQNYIHAYRATTGVDLTREDGVIDSKQPSVHLLRKLKEQNSKLRA